MKTQTVIRVRQDKNGRTYYERWSPLAARYIRISAEKAAELSEKVAV